MANPFDIDQILASRQAEAEATLPGKLENVSAITQGKLQRLSEFAVGADQRNAQRAAEREATKASLVGQLGLTPGSFTGNVVNVGASLASGASRFIGGIAALPDSAASNLFLQNVTNQEGEAIRRQQGGTATPADLALINHRPDESSLTVLEKFQASKSSRDSSIATNEAFNLTGLVEQTNREDFVADIGRNFDPDFGAVKEGLASISEGDVLSGAASLAKGVGNLIATAGSAILTNPAAIAEQVVENIPQIAVGAFGPVGIGVMTAGNIGFAMDIFQQGIVERTKANDGVEPTLEERSEMGKFAVAHVLSETVGDFITLGAAGALTDAVKNGIRKNFLNSVKNIGKAGAEGFVGEAPTEGAQTFFEGKILGEDASAKDIYVGSVIGGASGAGLAGGGRALTEAAIAATTSASEPKADAPDAPVTASQTEAIDSGNVDALTDPLTESYAPRAAIQALHGNSSKEGATQETKDANIVKANQIVTGLDDRIDYLQRIIKSPDAAQKDIDALNLEQETEDDPATKVLRQTIIDSSIAQRQAIIDNPPSKANTDNTTAEIAKLEGLRGPAVAARDILEQTTGITPTDVDTLVQEVDTPTPKVSPNRAKALAAARSIVEADDVGDKVHLTARRANSILRALDQATKDTDKPAQAIDRIREYLKDIPESSTTETTPEQTAQNADRVVTLAMASPDKISDAQLKQLANNESNTLTTPQRALLRELSAARIALNALQGVKGVNTDIINGHATDANNRGIKQYNAAAAKALTTGNKAALEAEILLLSKFVKSHTSKDAAVKAAFQTVNNNKNRISEVQVHAKDGGFFVAEVPFTDIVKEGEETITVKAQIAKNGGLVIEAKSRNIVPAIGKEAVALTRALSAMKAARDFRFNTPINEEADARNASAAESQNDVPPTPAEETAAAREDATGQDTGKVSKAAFKEVTATGKAKVKGEALKEVREEDAPLTSADLGFDGSPIVEDPTLPRDLLAEEAQNRRQDIIEASDAIREDDPRLGEASVRRLAEGVADEKAKARAQKLKDTNKVSKEDFKEVEDSQLDFSKNSPITELIEEIGKHLAVMIDINSDDANVRILENGEAGIPEYDAIFAVAREAFDGLNDALFNLLGQVEEARPKDVPLLEARRKAIRVADDEFLNQSAGQIITLAREVLTLVNAIKKGKANKTNERIAPESGITKIKKDFKLTLRDSKGRAHLAKDQLKANKATVFIGAGVEGSATAQYAKDAKAAKIPVNPDTITADDVVFISANGVRKGRVAPNTDRIDIAIAAGATIITDTETHRNKVVGGRAFNIGEQEVADHLNNQGYKEDNGTGVWTPVVEPTTDANTVVEDEVSTETPQEVQGFAVLQAERTAKGVAPKAYDKRNLIADFFKQVLNREGDTTLRPLVAVKDFLAPKLKFSGILEFLPQGKLKEEQKGFIQLFKNLHLSPNTKDLITKENMSWEAIITRNLFKKDKNKNDSDFYHRDLLQFLITRAEDGNPDIEQNAKTAIAYAAFNWLTSAAAGPRVNGAREVNALLGRRSDTPVSRKEMAILGSVGSLQSTIVNSMGMPAVQALGFKANKDTPVNLPGQLESAFGGQVFKLLHDIGVVETTRVESQVMSALRAETDKFGNLIPIDPRDESFQTFVRLVQVPQKIGANKLSPKAEEILAAGKGTQGILDKLFSVDSGLKAPTSEPVSFAQEDIRGQKVPEVAKAILEAENATPSFLDPAVLQLISIIDRANLSKILGRKSTAKQHGALIPGIDANNDAIERSIDNLTNYVSEMFTDGVPDVLQAIFFSHKMQVTQRVGIETTQINPQSDKFHRFALVREKWKTEITKDNLDAFLLVAGEGLGVKIDKQDNSKSVEEIRDIIFSKDIKAGVTALVFMLNNPDVTTMSDAHQAAVLKAVEGGKEKTHSLSALMALAKFQIARKEAQDAGDDTQWKFSTQLMGEVDGGNNGVMLSHLALGAASPSKSKTAVQNLFTLLNKGGFFENSDAQEDSQFNLWRSRAGNLDLYESTAANIIKSINSLTLTGIFSKDGGTQLVSPKNLKLAVDSIYYFTGELKGEDINGNPVVNKTGRDITKTPVLALAFGSSTRKAVEGMAEDYITAIYKKIADIGLEGLKDDNKGSQKDVLITNLNTMLKRGGASHGINFKKITSAQLMGSKVGTGKRQIALTEEQIVALKKGFIDTFGVAVESTLEADFAPLIEQRKQVNTGTQVTHAVFSSIETALIQEFKEAAMDASVDPDPTNTHAKLPFRIEKGVRVPLHDLTSEQFTTIREKLKAFSPHVATHMTNLGGKDAPIDQGILISKQESKLSKNSTYEDKSSYSVPFRGTGKRSITVKGNETTTADPGVRMVPLLTHSMEVATLLASLNAEIQQLNVFDAVGAGVGQLKEAAQRINASLFNVMLNYSPAEEVYTTFTRTLRGYETMLEVGNLPDAALENLVDSLEDMADKGKNDPTVPAFDTGMLFKLVQNMKSTAFKADTVKLDTLAQSKSFDQYAFEGGNYKVTSADRKAAVDKKAELTDSIDAETVKALKLIQAELAPIITKRIAEKAAAKRAKTTASKKKAAPKAKKQTPPVVKTDFGLIGKSSTSSDSELVTFFEKNPDTTAKRVIEGLERKYGKGSTLPNAAFNLQLLKVLKRAIAPDFKIKYITKTTQTSEILGERVLNARAWFASSLTDEGIYILGSDFVDSAVRPEVILHELVHAAVHTQITKSKPGKRTEAHIASLKGILTAAQKHIKTTPELEEKFSKLIGTDDAARNLEELVAWGMTNRTFQVEVLGKLDVGVKVKSGLEKFIDLITNLLFQITPKASSNSMATLINDVTSIIELGGVARKAAKKRQEQKNTVAEGEVVTRSMAAQTAPMEAIDNYTALEIFDAMDNRALDRVTQNRLRSVLTDIVETLHGPFGAFKESMRKDEATNPLAVWLKALDEGKAPFVSSILASGFTGSNQQDFVMEQVEVTMRAALSDKAITTTTVHRELTKLFDETRKRLKPVDFLGGAFPTNTLEEATALYDFVFTIAPGTDKRSDHLSRFAALGLGHKGVNRLLQVKTKISDKAEAKTFIEKLEGLFTEVLEFFQRRITGTYAGQAADFKLESLVGQLVSIEAKRRHTLKRKQSQNRAYLVPVEEAIKEGVDAALKKTVEALKHPLISEKAHVFIRAPAAVLSLAAGRHLDTFLDTMGVMRDKTYEGQLGIAAGLLNNIKGPVEAFSMLLRMRTLSEQEQVSHSNTLAKQAMGAFINKGRDLDAETKKAITRVFMRTGLHSLTERMSLTEIENLLDNPTAIEAEIAKLETELDVFGAATREQFTDDANALGYSVVTSIARVANLKNNTHQIVNQIGLTKNLTVAEKKAAALVVDPLIALYALRYSKGTTLVDNKVVTIASLAKKVMQTENARGETVGNGIAFVLLTSKQLQKEAQAKLFKGDPALMMHGYTPEIYNPHTSLLSANETAGKELEYLNYTKGSLLPKDPSDPNGEDKHIYVLSDGGMAPQITGVVGYGSQQAKGTQVGIEHLGINATGGAHNASAVAAVNAHRAKLRNTTTNPSRDLSKETGNYMAPIYNTAGVAVGWRHLMAESTKDVLLERNNDFSKLLGAAGGSILGKPATVVDNKRAFIAMREQFESEFATRGASYITVGPKSDDPELRAIYARLPGETKKDIKEIWGGDSVMVRKDSLDILFGYRKVSAADPFRRSVTERTRLKLLGLDHGIKDVKSINAAQKLLIGIVEAVVKSYARTTKGMTEEQAENYSKRIAAYVAKAENIWQGVVTEIKDIIVVKSGIVLAGNIFANFTMLHLQGVSWSDMVKHTLVAFKGAAQHRADSVELDQLQTQLATGYTLGQDVEIKRRIKVLESAIINNPVNVLISEAGLMPTIVEDVDMSEDIYSFKGALARKIDKVSDKLPAGVVSAARTLYMTRDGKMYKGLAHLTQMSDFVARYALYQHQTTRKKDPLEHDEAVQRASDAFVNYDIPLHRGMQYSDDMGFTLFTKYFINIQRELMRVSKENPGRVFTMILLNQFMNLGPIVLDSSVFSGSGSPFRPGALDYPYVLDELATISTTLAVIK